MVTFISCTAKLAAMLFGYAGRKDLKMGLNEKRKVEELKRDILPRRAKEIEEICGQPIQYEVDWDSIADDAAALNFLDNVSCHRLNMALRMICQDDLGKQAVRAGLKLVKLKNVADKSERHIGFANGILEMHCPYALGAAAIISDGEIRLVLEAGL